MATVKPTTAKGSNNRQRFGAIARIVSLDRLQHTSGGNSYCRGTIGVNEVYRKGDQNYQSTEFIPFTVWGKAAEVMAQHGASGRLVDIEGRMTSRVAELQGVKRVDSFEKFLSGLGKTVDVKKLKEAWEGCEAHSQTFWNLNVSSFSFLDAPRGTEDDSSDTSDTDTGDDTDVPDGF